MLYAVIPLEDNEHLPGRLRKVVDDLYEELSPRVFFVRYNGTATELSEALGFGDSDGAGDGIVLRVTYNAGYTYRTLWEWLEEGGRRRAG